MKTSIKPGQYAVGDRLDVKVERIVPNGLGLAFADGLTIFVALASAGDMLRVELTQLKKKIAFAEIVEVIAPSPDRILPPCQYFGSCGGCDFQQMNYTAQLVAKEAIIRDCLKRIGKIDFSGEIKMIPCPNEFNYRSRAQWHIDTRTKALGYFKRNSHEVIDIEECPILVPELNAELKTLRHGLEWEDFWDSAAKIEAAAGDDGAVSLFSPGIGEEAKDISSAIGGENYSYSAKGFFQGNRSMVDALMGAALDGAAGETALDLYCGVGLFALPLARKFGQVTGVEQNEDAVHFAKKNAWNAGLANIRFVRNSVDAFLKEPDLRTPDFLLLDPPRSGAQIDSIKRISALGPKSISYVSCEPSILARDLRIFLDGGYSIGSIIALDLFPQTHHVETVVRLSLT